MNVIIFISLVPEVPGQKKSYTKILLDCINH